MPKQKLSSLDQLAALTQQEILTVTHRIDGLDQKLDQGFRRIDDALRTLTDILDLMRADIRDVKITLSAVW